MTPLTPITKIISMEPVEKGSAPDWPNNVWVKGKVIRSNIVGFTIDDGTGTIFISTDHPVGVGQYVVVRGFTSKAIRNNNMYYPLLYSPDIHIVLFFPTETHLLPVILLITISGVVSTSIYWYRKNHSN